MASEKELELVGSVVFSSGHPGLKRVVTCLSARKGGGAACQNFRTAEGRLRAPRQVTNKRSWLKWGHPIKDQMKSALVVRAQYTKASTSEKNQF